MSSDVAVDADALREEVRSKYREVAIDPHGTYHFHTGRALAKRLGYDDDLVGFIAGYGGGIICRRRQSFFTAAACNRRVCGRCRIGSGFRLCSSPRARSGLRPRDRRGYDRGDAVKVAIHRCGVGF